MAEDKEENYGNVEEQATPGRVSTPVYIPYEKELCNEYGPEVKKSWFNR